ncbi:unnamed protein product [Diatraea saccharalis]|uniref:Palmitoyltransferase n=1 Tax=Diatraea saccharalis TaxID=40085 RepID=A0A9N9QVS2_9NEOP|nr:unnamed protein product [Diatraea saccharalis]
MIIKFESVGNKQLKRFLEHIFYLAIVFVLIPGFLYFEICIVLPSVTEQWTMPYFIHLFCAAFLLLNIIGNMIYGMFTDTSIKGKILYSYNQENWTMCSVCESLRPQRAWHCDLCNTCILKRDHHCTFFACCVGYYNHRYFILFTMYIFIAMVYSFYFNIKFVAQFITWNHGLIIAKFILPLASFVIDSGSESLYVLLVVINVIVGVFTGFLFFYHFNNILKGEIVPETKKKLMGFKYDKGWRSNLIEVFGSKWYVTWISPFIHSPLPGNGIQWDIPANKHK